jgi:hypothetical protein
MMLVVSQRRMSQLLKDVSIVLNNYFCAKAAVFLLKIKKLQWLKAMK